MKFDEIKRLDEVRMAPSNLEQFLNSPRAAGMRSGFEAELIFRGIGEVDYDNVEWVNDYDENRTADDIDDIIDFFDQNMSDYDLEQLRTSLTNDYHEWRHQKSAEDFMSNEEELVKDWLKVFVWDNDKKIQEYLVDELKLNDKDVQAAIEAGKKYESKITSTKQQKEFRNKDKNYDRYLTALDAVDEKLDELVQDEIDERADAWQNAYEEFATGDDYSEMAWLDDNNLTTMYDIENNYEAYWPYQVPDEDSIQGGFTYDAATELANNLEKTLGVKTVVSGSYHGKQKDGTSWYFEPDGSLQTDTNDDMPVEIVSPPMELKDTHAMLPKFFAWVESEDGYANDSTGFHMSLSMPNHDQTTVDYLKLALFLGDQHVLKSFEREANGYCKSSLKLIKNRLKGDQRIAANTFALAIERMRQNLLQVASTAVTTNFMNKFVTINDKGNYIEFRSAGGPNYFGDINRVQNTMLRYAYAMSIASDPEAERQEYAKKLYKFLDDTVDSEPDIMKYFVKYAAGELPQSALKSFIKQAQSNRELAKNPATQQDTGSKPEQDDTEEIRVHPDWPFPRHEPETQSRPNWPFPQGHRP